MNMKYVRLKSDFAFLTNEHLRKVFIEDINQFVKGSSFTIIAIVIRKDQLARQYVNPIDPITWRWNSDLKELADF